MTSKEINYVLENNSIVILFMHAEWCGPCKAMVPIIEEVANEYKGKALVMDIDVEDAEEVSTQFRIRNVPTIIFFKDGKAVDKVVGSTTKDTIVEKLEKIL